MEPFTGGFVPAQKWRLLQVPPHVAQKLVPETKW